MAIMENHFTKQSRNKHSNRIHNNAQRSLVQFLGSNLLGLEKETIKG